MPGLPGAAAEGVAAQCVTLWIGDRLGAVERACLRSVLRHGHALALYCYGAPEGVPAGVELRDAAGIVPEGRIVRHEGGSASLFSNLFRYALLQSGLGTWVDTDLYLVKPLDGEAEYLFGREASGRISTGVLRVPADSPMLLPMIEMFDEKKVMPWLSGRARIGAWWRLATTGRVGLGRLPWGSCGPQALTYYARAFGVAHHAAEPEVYYPVPWQQADWILEPGRSIEDVVGPRTVAVHLWNERIRGFKDEPAPAGSVLARLQAEGE